MQERDTPQYHPISMLSTVRDLIDGGRQHPNRIAANRDASDLKNTGGDAILAWLHLHLEDFGLPF